MKYRIKNGILLILVGISLFMIFHFSLRPECLFKKMTSIPCPACGLTRAYLEILKGNIIQSFSYNILAVPLFIGMLISIWLIIEGFFKNQDLFFSKMFSFFQKYDKFILFLLLISWILNIMRQI